MKPKFQVSDQVDRQLALAHYRKLASGYDASCVLIEPIRLKAIVMLNLQPGETVIDVASGTGKSIAPLSAKVGAAGCVIAIEQSVDMATLSQAHTTSLGLANIIHCIAPVEDAIIEKMADAALFHYTHDVFRTPAALANVFSAMRPGARVVVAGYKVAKGGHAVFNPWFKHRARGYLSTFEGLDAPWSHLVKFVPDFSIENEYFLGSGYLGIGTYQPMNDELNPLNNAGVKP